MKTKFNREPPEKSFIREILKAAEGVEGLVSFAGGIPSPVVIKKNIIPNLSRAMMQAYPDPESFVLSLYGLENKHEELPTDLQKISDLLRDEVNFEGTICSDLSYGSTPGTTAFRTTMAEVESERLGRDIPPENVQILSGSQEGISLVASLANGNTVMSEATYVGAIPIIRYESKKVMTVPIDNKGMVVEDLEKLLKTQHVDMVYVIPHGQNPMGVTLSMDRRLHLLDLAKKYGFLILEDDPYYGTSLDPIQNMTSFDPDYENTILLRSFSKELFPSRVGYAIGSKENIEQLETLKGARNLQTSKLDQRLMVNLVQEFNKNKGGYNGSYLKSVAEIYARKRDSMIMALDNSFSGMDISFTRPNEGFFIWMTLPSQVDTLEMYPQALEQKIAYVPGAPFDPMWKNHPTNSMDSKLHNSMRLNYSYPSVQDINDGSKRLAELVSQRL